MRHQTLGSVAFPVSDEAKQAKTDLGNGVHEHVQLKIDLKEEKIHLVTASKCPLENLPSKILSDCARYHLYNFEHTHEGDYMERVVILFIVGLDTVAVSKRGCYSFCKAPLLKLIQLLGVTIVKKLSIDDGEESTDAFLHDELYPKVNLYQPKFTKPKGPPNRGAKRITKVQESEFPK